MGAMKKKATMKASEIKVGDAVEGLYWDGSWHPATIKQRLKNGTFELAWDDHDTKDRIKDIWELRKAMKKVAVKKAAMKSLKKAAMKKVAMKVIKAAMKGRAQ